MLDVYRGIITRTNLTGVELQQVEKLKGDIELALELLINHTQIYLKLEWERIKDETLYEGDVSGRRNAIREQMHYNRARLYEERKSLDQEIYEELSFSFGQDILKSHSVDEFIKYLDDNGDKSYLEQARKDMGKKGNTNE